MIPFFKRTKAAFIYTTIGLTFFVVLTVPFLLLSKQSSVGLNFIAFFNQNSVGFHLRRFLQVADTAFLESILIIGSQMTGFLKYFLLPVFIALYVLTENKKPFLKINTKKIYTGLFVRKNWPQFKKRKITFLYLLTLWYVVPWVALSMYQGELTPYYFALTRYVSLCLMAYILYTFIRWKRAIFVPLALVVGALFFMWNTGQFLNYKTEGLKDLKKHAYDDFKHSRGNIFTYGAAETYLYYFYEYRAYGKK